MGTISTAFSTLIAYWPVLLGCAIIAMLMGFVWLIFLRMFVKIMVLVTIFALALFLIGVTVLFWAKAGKIDFSTVPVAAATDAATQASSGVALTQQEAEYVAIAMSVITAVYLLLLIVMLKRILIACAIIQEAAKALGAMPTIIFWPVVTFFSVALLSLWWIIVAAYLASAGEFDPKTMTFKISATKCVDTLVADGAGQAYAESTCSIYKGDTATAQLAYAEAKGSANFTSIATSTQVTAFASQYGVTLNADTYNYFILYHIFGFLWTYAFTLGVSYMTLAGAYATWYWTFDKKVTQHPRPLTLAAVR